MKIFTNADDVTVQVGNAEGRDKFFNMSHNYSATAAAVINMKCKALWLGISGSSFSFPEKLKTVTRLPPVIDILELFFGGNSVTRLN